MKLLFSQTTPSDVVVRNFPDPAFDYYYQATAPSTTLPDAVNAARASTEQRLAELLDTHDYLWFLPTDSDAFDKDRVVAAWLSTHAELISDQWIGATHLLQYARPSAVPRRYHATPNITFEKTARLLGYRITPPAGWQQGAQLSLELFWEPIGPTETTLTVFVHLLGPPNEQSSPLWGQDDHLPRLGAVSTKQWQSGSSFRDLYHLTIPANAPPGAYHIAIGFYDPLTGNRVPLTSPHARIDNEATILTFELLLPP
jgi:hypothetical protein